MQTQAQQTVKETVRQVIEQREEIIRAFIAKYECGPDEIIQVMQKTEEGVKFCVRKKDENEQALGTVMHYLDKAIGDCGSALTKAQIMNDKTKAVIMKLRSDCYREIRTQLKQRMKEQAATEAPQAVANQS